ncbi:hypothetical protein QVD17_20133 [Tagetes erecta]|uniref:Uncharacterized protein n=1 Tax=Tagetes erecta TaxID=13708 RepID=A0AAD8KSB0_TARER|nr:hypothetical protein QVD17_20133 [Tagetes erecta]
MPLNYTADYTMGIPIKTKELPPKDAKKSLDMDESIRNQVSLPAATPYKFHEKRSADSAFFVEEPNDDQSEESEGAFYVGSEQRGSKQQSRSSSSKQGSSSEQSMKTQDVLSIILQSPERKQAYPHLLLGLKPILLAH